MTALTWDHTVGFDDFEKAKYSVGYDLEEMYFKETGALPRLTRAEELLLFKERDCLRQERNKLDPKKDSDATKIDEIDEALAAVTKRVISANVRFVVSVAREFLYRGLDLFDLIALGNKGMLEAFNRFEYERGFKFISYAVWWIRQAIQQGLLNDLRVVRLSASVHDTARTIIGTLYKVEQELGRTIDPANGYTYFMAHIAKNGKLQKKLGHLTEDRYREVLSQNQMPTSFNAPLYPEETTEHIERIAVDDLDPGVALMLKDSEQLVQRLLDFLETQDPRLRYVVEHRFGLNGQEILTLERIGQCLGFTRERARQLQKRAMWLMQHHISSLSLSKEEVLYGV